MRSSLCSSPNGDAYSPDWSTNTPAAVARIAIGDAYDNVVLELVNRAWWPSIATSWSSRPVVEARLELQSVRHRAAHRHDPAYELLWATDGHEVLDLARSDNGRL